MGQRGAAAAVGALPLELLGNSRHKATWKCACMVSTGFAGSSTQKTPAKLFVSSFPEI